MVLNNSDVFISFQTVDRNGAAGIRPGYGKPSPGGFYITSEYLNARFAADKTILSVLLIVAVFSRLGRVLYATDYGGDCFKNGLSSKLC